MPERPALPNPFPCLLVAPGEDATPYADAVRAHGAEPSIVAPNASLPAGAGGLLAAGEAPFGLLGEPVPAALTDALEAGLPVLGIGWGMYAINAAFGGRPPVELSEALLVAPAPSRRRGRGESAADAPHRTFLPPGCKVAATIGAGGVAPAPPPSAYGIREAEKARPLLASAYALNTGVIEALELPGFPWVIGVSWPLHRAEVLADRFEQIIMAFVEKATGAA